MRIGGLQKVTLIDYPGKVAATVFLIGCNFRCPYCHNPELVTIKELSRKNRYSSTDFFKFLDTRDTLLDGVCITGGEPTINSDLPKFIQEIKKRGFLVKLDTNGSNPGMLKRLIEKRLVDFIAMDIKTSTDVKIKNPCLPAGRQKSKIKNYDIATGTNVDINKIKKSVDLIRNSGVDYEFRTTVVPKIIKKEDIENIGKWLKGSNKFVLQQFRPDKVLNSTFKKIKPYSDDKLKEFLEILKPYIKEVELRA